MWCDKEQIDWVFEKTRILPGMKVNHFRGWYELCRKDMLNKNLKRFKRNLEKQNNREESNEYDFLPSTYLLPSEYVIFYEEFKRHQNEAKCLWIMKPVHFQINPDFQMPGQGHLYLQAHQRHRKVEDSHPRLRNRKLRLPKVPAQPAAVRRPKVRHANLRPLHQLPTADYLLVPRRVCEVRP